jgi:hypothetical protein
MQRLRRSAADVLALDGPDRAQAASAPGPQLMGGQLHINSFVEELIDTAISVPKD